MKGFFFPFTKAKRNLQQPTFINSQKKKKHRKRKAIKISRVVCMLKGHKKWNIKIILLSSIFRLNNSKSGYTYVTSEFNIILLLLKIGGLAKKYKNINKKKKLCKRKRMRARNLSFVPWEQGRNSKGDRYDLWNKIKTRCFSLFVFDWIRVQIVQCSLTHSPPSLCRFLMMHVS